MQKLKQGAALTKLSDDDGVALVCRGSHEHNEVRVTHVD